MPRLMLMSLLLSASTMCWAADPPSEDLKQQEVKQCTEHLEQIYEAIQNYREEKKRLPDWLSDLVDGKYLDADALICPVTARTGETNLFGVKDPRVKTSYIYEFCAMQVPGEIWGGSKRTMREWKQRQMGLVGSAVPILRCHLHSPVLNVSFDGEVYESPTSWEEIHLDKVRMEEFSPAALFGPQGVNPFPIP